MWGAHVTKLKESCECRSLALSTRWHQRSGLLVPYLVNNYNQKYNKTMTRTFNWSWYSLSFKYSNELRISLWVAWASFVSSPHTTRSGVVVAIVSSSSHRHHRVVVVVIQARPDESERYEERLGFWKSNTPSSTAESNSYPAVPSSFSGLVHIQEHG